MLLNPTIVKRINLCFNLTNLFLVQTVRTTKVITALLHCAILGCKFLLAFC